VKAMPRIFVMTLLFCSAAQALEPGQVREKASLSIVLVRALDKDETPIRTGNGVVIQTGIVITNCHVLAKAKKLQVQHDDIIYPATLQYPDIERDLCQLAVAKLPAPAVSLGGTAVVRLGQPVYALSASRTGELSLIQGKVSALREYRGMSLIETSAVVSQEGFDTLLFDPEGRLVGMTTSVVMDSPQAHYAIAADAFSELPRRAMEALRAQSGDKAPLFKAEWNSRIALLENASGDITLSQAIAMLLDISSESEVSVLLAHEGVVRRKPWHNSYAMGTDSKGNLIWGGSYRLINVDGAAQTALDQCMSAAGDSCQVIMVDGEFHEKEFLVMAKTLGHQNIAATRQAFLQSLARSPVERRIGFAAGAMAGANTSSMGFSSVRQ